MESGIQKRDNRIVEAVERECAVLIKSLDKITESSVRKRKWI